MPSDRDKKTGRAVQHADAARGRETALGDTRGNFDHEEGGERMAELKFMTIQFKNSSAVTFAAVTSKVAARVQSEYASGIEIGLPIDAIPAIRFEDKDGSIFVLDGRDIRMILVKEYKPEVGGGARQ